jgi:hypothetical protein
MAARHPKERKTPRGEPPLSNHTDNKSAKLPTDKAIV